MPKSECENNIDLKILSVYKESVLKVMFIKDK
jgi:hypothetical protein